MTRVRLGELSDLSEGTGFRVEVGDSRLAVFRVGDSVYALGDRCSHAEASLSEGEVFDGEVECPRHGATFDLESGRPTALPASKPVPTYEVSIESGWVFVEVED
ncbi:MAG: non-heme iron oxygenase ferredoxin subunit [Acidimicrobiia bacterium]|nr:non-heme iron oxygenase ferredoxin subunit [Acidimicrobiia bacterium]MDH5294514.1 non-heme iron oxygenase ferredoxin subunit [Acidimicrobiia bacterium]